MIKSNFFTLREPYKITFAVTYRCNSRCKTCNIWKRKPVDELTTEEIEKILSNIRPSWLNLTGGEPFLRKDLYEIAKISKRRGVCMLNMTTNGLVPWTLEEIKKISKQCFFRSVVTLSLDGPEKVHDRIKGIEGSWKRVMNLYRELKKIKSSGFQTYLGYTISKYNLGMIEETLKEADVDIKEMHFNLFHSSFYYGVKGKQDRIFLKDVNYVIKNKKSFGILPFVESKYMVLVKKYFDSKKIPLPCRALRSSCFIEPNGDVYPCSHYDMKLGNLRDFDYDLKKIWNSEKAEETRRLIRENKCGGCWTPCEAYQTILGNILRI